MYPPTGVKKNTYQIRTNQYKQKPLFLRRRQWHSNKSPFARVTGVCRAIGLLWKMQCDTGEIYRYTSECIASVPGNRLLRQGSRKGSKCLPRCRRWEYSSKKPLKCSASTPSKMSRNWVDSGMFFIPNNVCKLLRWCFFASRFWNCRSEGSWKCMQANPLISASWML